MTQETVPEVNATGKADNVESKTSNAESKAEVSTCTDALVKKATKKPERSHIPKRDYWFKKRRKMQQLASQNGKQRIGTRKSEKHAIDNMKHKHRFRNGTRALMEIRQCQKSTRACIPFSNFRQLVRGIIAQFKPEARVQKKVYGVLQEAAEVYLTEKFALTQRLACRNGLQGIKVEDFQEATKWAMDNPSLVAGLDEFHLKNPHLRTAPRGKAVAK